MNNHIEKTLVLIKPDGVERGLVGEIVHRFERVGLKIVGMKMVHIDAEFARKHYFDVEQRKGPKVFEMLMELITMGPVIAMVLEGVSAIEIVRKMAGPTEPSKAMPGTIRGDFAQAHYAMSDEVEQAVRNIVHASGSKEDAAKEVPLWFKDNEIYSYENVHEFHIFHKKRNK